jgi:hypothetical protein
MARTSGVRGLAAIAYAGSWAAFLALVPDPPDAVALPLWIGGGLAAGLVIGRWWALLLAPVLAGGVLIANAVSPCDSSQYECDVRVVWLAVVLFMPFTAAIVGTGVGLSKVARRSKVRRNA